MRGGSGERSSGLFISRPKGYQKRERERPFSSLYPRNKKGEDPSGVTLKGSLSPSLEATRRVEEKGIAWSLSAPRKGKEELEYLYAELGAIS